MNAERVRGFIRGYDFPAHLFVVWDHLQRRLSIWCSTLRAKILFRTLGCPYGRDLSVDGRLVIRAPRRGAIRLGDHVGVISRFSANLVGLTNPTVFQCLGEGRIVIGNHSGCSSAVLSASSRIQVGDYVMIGGNVRIFDHDYHPLDPLSRRDPLRGPGKTRSAPVFIGNDVFIGTNAIILKGVQVGDRCIIGAGAVVALKNIPPDSVVAGNPARVIRSLKETGGDHPPTSG